MSDADIARQSNDSDGYIVIAGDGDAALNMEVQEDIIAQKLGTEEERPGREAVNLDELGDMLNDGTEDYQPEENGAPAGNPVSEEQIAQVKLGGRDSGSIQWPGGEEEGQRVNGVCDDKAGNAAITVTLGKTGESAEDPTETVSNVRPGLGSVRLSDRIRAFEKKKKENEPIHAERKRNKLNDTKFGKYQKSMDQPDIESKQRTGSKRLDKTKFSLFEKKSEDSTDGQRNFTVKPGIKKSRFASQGPSSTDASNRCLVCEKRVYPMEKITADGKSYHKSCFRCTECKKVLSLGNYAAIKSCLFCKPHFTQRFKLHGSYDKGFSQGTSLRSPHTEEFNHVNADRAIDEIATTEAQTTESTPVIPTDDTVVRSYEQQEDPELVPGMAKSIREQFNKGQVSNVEIKRTIDNENVNINSLENYKPPEYEEEEDTHIKPQDIIDRDRDQGQTAESNPQVRDDVVRSYETSEDVCSGAGLKNLKSMFEKGGVSNVEKKAEREKIEVRSLEDVDGGAPQGVAENVPQERRPDVVTGGTEDEDPGIKVGFAQRIKARFEKGPVSNIEEKTKSDLERAPKSLEDYTDDSSNQSVSESTPQRRDDVVRSDIPLEEQVSTAGGTRSLLSKWEKGEVEHAEEKPKEVISDPKDLMGDSQFAESTPEIREDLVRETDETDTAIPEGVTKNIQESLEGTAEINVEVSKSLESEPKVNTEIIIEADVTENVESEPKDETLHNEPRVEDETAINEDSGITETLESEPRIIESAINDDSGITETLESEPRSAEDTMDTEEVGVTESLESQPRMDEAEFNVEVGITESLESEPKRLSEGGEDDTQFEINVEVNGNVSPAENGHANGNGFANEEEATPNGHYKNDDEGVDVAPSQPDVDGTDVDASAEIKAARAAAADDDEDSSAMLMDSR